MVDDLPVHLLAYMAPQDSMSDALRQLKRQASKEQDPEAVGSFGLEGRWELLAELAGVIHLMCKGTEQTPNPD